jgi:hypothetical protein
MVAIFGADVRNDTDGCERTTGNDPVAVVTNAVSVCAMGSPR